MTTVISHLSALRAIRRARRAYSALPWGVIDDEQQAQALADCVPNKDAIDFAALAILDAWSEDDPERLDLFVAGATTDGPTNGSSSTPSPPRFPKVQLCTLKPTSTLRLPP